MNKKIITLAAILTLGFSPLARCEEKSLIVLPKISDKLANIVTSEDWQPVVTGLGFSDGLSADPATGNVYFSDMKGATPALYILTPELEKKQLTEAKISGTRASGDYKILYGIGNKKVVAFPLPAGPIADVAEVPGTNDLAVSREGRIYFTGVKGQVTMLDIKSKEIKPVDTGHLKNPNGIGLSPDQKTLYVSDYGGTSVWSFVVQADGMLKDAKEFCKLQPPTEKPEVSGGDGMTIDADGRIYVTSKMGLQVIAPNGELLGVIPKPKPALVSCTFGGKNMEYLYIGAGDTIYRRKMQVKGVNYAK